MTEFHAGDSVAGYTVSGSCGSGSYGEVYRVSDSLGAELALKVLSAGKASEREIGALLRFRACRHPNLLTVLHVGELPDGRFFYTMDLADSADDAPGCYRPDTLAARLTKGPIAPDEAERILRELLAGLGELHRAHLLHRDIKPANILFIRGRAVLADIGLVTPDASASLIGTPDYLPGELLKSHRSMTGADDCYALGLILYCMLTGEPPRHFPGVPKTLRDLSALRLLKVAEKACMLPGFANAGNFLEELDRPVLSHGSRKWLLLCGGVFLAVLAALGVLRFQQGKTPSPSVPVREAAVSPDHAPIPKDSAPIIYAPEVAALLKKYQLTEAEEAERNRRLAVSRKLDEERTGQIQQEIAQISQLTDGKAIDEAARNDMEKGREYQRRYQQLLDTSPSVPVAEMQIKSLLEKIGSDTPTSSELKRLEKALQRRKQAYSAKKP